MVVSCIALCYIPQIWNLRREGLTRLTSLLLQYHETYLLFITISESIKTHNVRETLTSYLPNRCSSFFEIVVLETALMFSDVVGYIKSTQELLILCALFVNLAYTSFVLYKSIRKIFYATYISDGIRLGFYDTMSHGILIHSGIANLMWILGKLRYPNNKLLR